MPTLAAIGVVIASAYLFAYMLAGAARRGAMSPAARRGERG